MPAPAILPLVLLASQAPAETRNVTPRMGRRAFWFKQLRLWHWVSSAACMAAMLLFSVTGITLNHAAEIPTRPRVATIERVLPEALRKDLDAATRGDSKGPVPAPLAAWARRELGVALAGREAERSGGELYVSLPRAGGDAWLTADLETGAVRHELTDRGWIAYVNDLHKGRHTGVAWKWFIDGFAVASVIFTLTGLALLWFHAGGRPGTWPLVAFGLVLPLLLAALFIHP